jgi:hypothetical protein
MANFRSLNRAFVIADFGSLKGFREICLIIFENLRAAFHRGCSPAIACSPRYALLHCGLPALSGLFTKDRYGIIPKP